MRAALIVGSLLVLLGIVGAMDVDAEAASEAEYCEMVKAGHWPAFKKGVDCGQ